jgi:hypothetical protein
MAFGNGVSGLTPGLSARWHSARELFFPIPGAELAVPLVPDDDPLRFNQNTVNFLRMVGRIRPGVTLEQAQAEMNALAVKLRQQFPEPSARKLGVKLTPMRDQVTGGYRRALLVLLAAVGFLLLIACANLANLNLVRASASRKEMSILSALGATRWQVVKQLLLESALLAAAGGSLGLLLAHLGVRALLALTPANVPRAGDIGLDAPVLAFTVLISLLAAIATGLVPAFACPFRKNRYPHMEDVTGFYDALLPRIQTVSGVSAAGVIQMLPLSGLISRIPFTVVGRAFSQEEIPEAEYRIVSSMYLNVMHIPLLAGREFSESDTDQTRLVCHINETLAKRYWPAGDAVDSSSPWREEKVRYRERLGGLVAALASLHGEGDEDDWTFAADAAVTVTDPTDNHTIDNPKGLPAHELYVIIDAALQGDGSRLARVAYQANVLVQDTEPDLDSILLSLGEGEFVPALSVSVTGGAWLHSI